VMLGNMKSGSNGLFPLLRPTTRAEITPTRFWNEYQWGSLKADPAPGGLLNVRTGIPSG
jgi:hypothetical protein